MHNEATTICNRTLNFLYTHPFLEKKGLESPSNLFRALLAEREHPVEACIL
jgi:hypothetical protein